MTPDKRLDQIEPVMADVLQKVDRLIEGQGQLVELSTNTKAELEQVKTTGNATARAVANLTVATQRQFDQLNNRFNEVDNRFGQVDTRFDQVDNRFGQVDTRFDQVDNRFDEADSRFDQLDANQNGTRQDIGEMRQDIANLKAGQELILQILREKLP